jgi:regulator of sirC expression with transglutaminase-like and TPR domain
MSALDDVCKGRPACIATAALEIARDEYPDLDVRSYVNFLRTIRSQFASRLSGSLEPEQILRLLNDFFFAELEFTGNMENYYDPRNSYLNDVLDRRMGIPITLSIVYRLLAASAGVALEGINFPGHFLLAYERPSGRRIYIDVFRCGEWLRWEDCQDQLRASMGRGARLEEGDFVPMTDASILLRMLRNLKGIYSRSDLTRCLRVQERIVQIAPDDPDEARDLGILYFHAGKPMRAIQTLERLVRDHPEVGEREVVAGYIHKAAREAALLN